jgi:hypothetical protein
MNNEDMKSAFGNLDKRLDNTEKLEETVMKYIRSKKVKSAYDKMYSKRLHELYILILLGCLVLPIYQVNRGFNIITFIAAEAGVAYAIAAIISLMCALNKFNLDGPSETLKQCVTNYKRIDHIFSNFSWFVVLLLSLIILYYECAFAWWGIAIVAVGVIIGLVLNYFKLKNDNEISDIEDQLES